MRSSRPTVSFWKRSSSASLELPCSLFRYFALGSPLGGDVAGGGEGG